MPVITLYLDRFSKILGRATSIDEMHNWLPWLGLDIEEIGEDYVKVEYNPNRPDFGTPVGIAKAFEGLLRWKTGLTKYEMEDSNLELFVDSSVKEVRPYIVGGIIKGININADVLNELIEFQEDLHMGIGRKRRKVAIGLHNLDKIKFPIRYTTVNKSFSFIPLEFDRKTTIEEILKSHSKGKEYGHILAGSDKYPIILDSENKVLSFPPVINGVYTVLTSEAKNIFIDVTGTDLKTILRTLTLLVTTLADYGGKIYSIKIIRADHKDTFITPILDYKKIVIEPGYINKLLGLDMSIEEILDALKASRYSVTFDEENGLIKCIIPPYRIDILHKVDIIEDVALGYGLWKIKPSKLSVASIGSKLDKEKLLDRIANLMIGFGFQEVINPILTNPEDQYDKMRVPRPEYAEVKSPKSLSYRSLRTWIVPSLLINLYRSKGSEYPQKIFEIGDVVVVWENKIIEKKVLSVAMIGTDIGYAYIKSIFDSFISAVGNISYDIIEEEHPSFISGRVGMIKISDIKTGFIGELHPQVISNFQLNLPIAVFEIDLEPIYKVLKNKKY